MKILSIVSNFGALTFIAGFIGYAKAVPGYFFPSETAYHPPPSSVYYVSSPSHGGHSYDGPSSYFSKPYGHGPPPTRTYKYVKKSPVSPYSVFSVGPHSHAPYGSSGGPVTTTVTYGPSSVSSGSGGWSYGGLPSKPSRGKGKSRRLPIIMSSSPVSEDEMSYEQMSNLGEDVEGPLSDSGAQQIVDMNEIINSDGLTNSGNVEPEEPNSQFAKAVMNPPQIQMVQRQPPRNSAPLVVQMQGGNAGLPTMMQSGYPGSIKMQGGYPTMMLALRQQSIRQRPATSQRPSQSGPSSQFPSQRGPPPPQITMNEVQENEEPQQDDQPQNDFPIEAEEEGISGEPEQELVEIRMPTRGRGAAPRNPSRGSSSVIKTLPRGRANNGISNSGWSSGVSEDAIEAFFQAPIDYNQLFKSAGPSISGGWGSSSGSSEEETSSPDGSEGSVEDTVTTEESEDRQPPPPKRKKPSRRPSASPSSASSQGRTNTNTKSSSRPNSSSSSSSRNNNQNQSQRPSVTASQPPAEPNETPQIQSIPGRQVGNEMKRPQTNQPQPDQQQQNISSGQSSSVQYGVPGEQPGSPISQGSSGNSNNGQVRIGDQVISNDNGLLDEELIRTVQEIINNFDKN